ncbi:MAG: alpha/beta hydrolase [Capsulimonadaceae bacterium]|nr:alpha/beta hydrolase [Capsulimonadaceae bacterium]
MPPQSKPMEELDCPPRAPVWKTLAIMLLSLLAAGYGLLAALAYFNQRALVFPGSLYQDSDRAQLLPADGVEVVSLTTPRLRIPIKALYGKALNADGTPDPLASRRPTVLFFYGNGSYLSCSTEILNGFRRLNVNVIIPEYPGYGVSGGTVSEDGCYDAADAAYALATRTLGVQPQSIVVAGWSLGSGVAVNLASQRPVRGLILCSAYTSIAETAAYRYKIFPAPLIRLLLKYRFPSEARIGKVRCPILIAHGDCDHSVPYAMSGRLVRAAHAPVTFVRVHGVAHNDFFSSGGGVVYPRIREWMSNLKQSSTNP